LCFDVRLFSARGGGVEGRGGREIGEVVIRAIDAAVEVLYREAANGSPARADSSRIETNGDVPAGTPTNGSVGGKEADDNVEAAAGVPAETQAADDLDRGAVRSIETQADIPDTQCKLEPLAARRADGLRLLADSFLFAPPAGRVDTSADRYQVVVHIDQALLSGAVKSRLSSGESSSTSCQLDGGTALAVETARRLGCDATLVGIVEDENGEPLNVGRRTRALSPALRRALRARDGGCRFPGCGRSRFTHAHHVVHWADGGETSLKNLITLCTFHHALVHEGGYSIRRLEDGSFAFLSPEGERLPETGRLVPRAAEVLIQAADRGQVTLRELGLLRFAS